jgi:hypothetical protein
MVAERVNGAEGVVREEEREQRQWKKEEAADRE